MEECLGPGPHLAGLPQQTPQSGSSMDMHSSQFRRPASPRLRCPSTHASGESRLPYKRPPFRPGRRNTGNSWVPFCESTSPPHEAPPPQPYDLSISQRPHLRVQGCFISTYEPEGVWAEIFSLWPLHPKKESGISQTDV